MTGALVAKPRQCGRFRLPRSIVLPWLPFFVSYLTGTRLARESTASAVRGRPCAAEERREVGRQRAGEAHLPPVRRGGESARRAACRNWRSSPSGRAPPAVLHVAGHGVAERREVHADLVRAAGLELHAHEREARGAAEHAEVRHRALAGGRVQRHALAVAHVPADGRVDGALVLGQVAAQQRRRTRA